MIPYAKELEQIMERLRENEDTPKKKLLLHSCCAPCSTHVLEYLRDEFAITVFYYNPNVSEQKEYDFRMQEQLRLIELMNEEAEKTGHGKIEILEGEYDPGLFYEAVKGMEDCKEGKERCERCFGLRLKKTAEKAQLSGFDYFTTTLTISPMKNAVILNEIGKGYAEEYKVDWLPSDFKKKNGYKHSVELSHRYRLYRQDYCGCIFSKRERERERESEKVRARERESEKDRVRERDERKGIV